MKSSKIVSLTQFNIKRPERLLYEFALPSDPALLPDYIKSKSLKSFLLKTDEILAENNINWNYEDLTEEKFIEWLPYYKEKMEEHNYDVRAKKEWYEEQTKQGVALKGIFLYKNEKEI